MDFLEKIPFSDENKRKIETSIQNYSKFARIVITGELLENKSLIITIAQLLPVVNKVLTETELKQRAVDVFEGLLPEGYTYYIKPNALGTITK